ncbi:MAG: RDD family protein [Gemmatimonadetes bacterium]|nr:RDD family protein [Gemmatimonadota bacterium]
MRIASRGRRLVAGLIDVALLPAVAVLGLDWTSVREGIPTLIVGGAILLWWAATLGFWTDGRSVGKWLLGLRVVNGAGRPLGFLRMMVREVVGKLGSGPTLALPLGWILVDADRQGLHDKLAASYVVDEATGPVRRVEEKLASRASSPGGA